MNGKTNHLRTLGPAPSSAAAQQISAPVPKRDKPPELPPEYFRELLTPRCKRDGVCDECGMCGH